MAKSTRTARTSASKGKRVVRSATATTSSSSSSRPSRSKKSTSMPSTTTERSKKSSTTSKDAGSLSSSSTTRRQDSTQETRALSDESEDDDDDDDDDDDSSESDPEDHDRQLGLRPTLRVVSKATVQRSWKPVSTKSRTHIQTLVNSLFPAAINRAKGEQRKIALQMRLSRMMQKMNDSLSELKVPPAGRNGVPNYTHLTALNRDLEAKLVPDLEHIRNLELRLEQEQILLEQEKAQLEAFKDSKRELDRRTTQLHRSKLHPLLKEPQLPDKMVSLCKVEPEYSHLSVEDQRLLSMMQLEPDEGFANADIREPTYNVIALFMFTYLLTRLRHDGQCFLTKTRTSTKFQNA
ncbi:hypothetical protein BGZ94_007925 [Podila epigama]|nr:hypothetical protein BGZ94_007925 [Podila epigama]